MKDYKVFILSVLFVLCCLQGAWADMWGLLSDYPQSIKQPQASGRYLMPLILQKKPVRVFLSVKDSNDTNYAYYQSSIQESYNKWFSYPASLIRKQGREDEFLDILPILERGVEVRFVDKDQPRDIEVTVLGQEEMKIKFPGMQGYYEFAEQGKAPQIGIMEAKTFYEWKKFGTTMLHETGHSLGLSDQYPSARTVNSHPVFSSEDPSRGVMGANASLSCDEADGMINLIDLTRHTARGGRVGWRSLCKKSSVYYVNGAPITKGPYLISPQNRGESWLVEIYEEGEKTAEKIFAMNKQYTLSPYEALQEQVQEVDFWGRPVFALGPAGEEIYYSYVYEKTIRLVTKRQTVLSAEVSNVKEDKKSSGKMNKAFTKYFGEGGVISVVGFVRPAQAKNSKEGLAFYISDFNERRISDSVYLNFNRKGKLTGNKTDTKRILVKRPLDYSLPKKVRLGNYAGKMDDALSLINHQSRLTKIQLGLAKWYLQQVESPSL